MQLDELLKLAKKGKLDELESVWVSAVDAGSPQWEGLLDVPEVLADRGHADMAESLLWYLVDARRESGDPEGALASARRGGQLLPDSDVMRALLVELCAEAYGDREDLQDLMRLTLDDARVPLDEALAALEKMLSLLPGAYVLDSHYNAVGRVDGFDAARGGVVVDLADSTKVYGIGLVHRLELVGADDFRALCAFEQERLQSLAREDPEQLIQLALNALDRRMPLQRLRVYLEPVVGSWSKWWTAARKKLERSSVIGMTGGRTPSLFLRSRPLSHGERLIRQFDTIEEPVAKLAAALRILGEAKAHGDLESEALQRVADGVGRIGRQEASASLPVALAGAAVADAFRLEFPDVSVGDTVSTDAIVEVLRDAGAFAAAVRDEEVLLCALDFVRKSAPRALSDFCIGLMPLLERGVCDKVARNLLAAGAGGPLVEAAQEILARSDRTPGSLAWLWRACAGAPAEPLRQAVEPAAVAMQLLATLAALVRAGELTEEERKEQISEVRSALFMRSGGSLRQVLEGARPEQLAAVKALGERNPGLTLGMQADLIGMVSRIRPELFEKAVPPWEEDVVYTTKAGTEKRKAELEHIAHVRLPEIMREIGQAASFGDVTDNAEYRAAVEERARLAQRAARMQEELAGARLITAEVAAADHVTVGSRVQARNLATGQVQTITFLGPWDARPEQDVYAYDAPLGLAFMGKRVGDTVTYSAGPEERRWEILQVGPGI